MKKQKNFYDRYKHGIPLIIYLGIYLAWFAWLEQRNIRNYRIIHVPMDDHIPFCEIFIIPYLLWFVYVSVVVVYLFFKNKTDYYRCCIFLFTGMTVFLVISTLWPNGHHLRPTVLPRDNFFTRIISFLWKVDTPTNLWPSIHVFNSMGAHFAIMHNKDLLLSKHGHLWRFLSGILAISIIMSTVLLKQHSVFDVITGLIMGLAMYVLVYRRELLLLGKTSGRKKRTPQAG